MAGEQDMDLRVGRLENDVSAIYDLITDLRSTQEAHTLRFDAMDRRFDAMDHRFDAMDRRFDATDRRLDGVDGALEEILRRLPETS